MQAELEAIIDAIDAFLDNNASTNEHAVISHCQQLGLEPFSQLNLKQSRELFCAHFLAKHALYTLQNRYLEQKSFYLNITSVKLERLPYTAGQAALAHHDSVKQYYLNLDHYFETSEDEVNQLLQDFWTRFLAGNDKTEALQTLGLPADADYPAVKQRYRALAQQHHPDKGGCDQKFQQLSEAKRILDSYFGR